MSLTLPVATLGAAALGSVTDFIGGLFGNSSSKKQLKEAQRQFDTQMDFAKNQTQYRVQDALKAGINPLAALGMSSNFSPTISSYGGDNSMGNAISRAGDRFSRALEKIANKETKDQFDYNSEVRSLDLESRRIDNQIKKAQLASYQSFLGPQELPPNNESSLFVPVYDMEGRPRLMVNQDVTENDSDNAAYISSLKGAIASGQIHPFSGKVMSKQLRMKIADDYKRRTGRNIENLEELYFAPSEVATAAYQLARGF